MEPSNPSITANTAHSINPTDVVKKVMLYVGAYGLDKGKALFERIGVDGLSAVVGKRGEE